MEEFALIAQLKHYGIDFLIPKHIDIEKTEYEENDYEAPDPTEDRYYFGYEYDDEELDDIVYDDEDVVIHTSNDVSIVEDIDGLMQVFNLDYIEPEEFLSKNIWDLFEISKKQFDLINWQMVPADDFCKFYDRFTGSNRRLPIEKRIKYSIADAVFNYRRVAFYSDDANSDDEMLKYAEHIIDTHSFDDSQHLIDLLIDYLRFFDDAVEMDRRRYENGELAFHYVKRPKPSHLRDLHDKAFRDHQAMETERLKENRQSINARINGVSMTPEYKNLLYKNDKYVVSPVSCQEDLDIEGHELNHCVASYGGYMAKGQSYIYLVRKVSEPTKPFYTAEIIPPNTYETKSRPVLNQLYTYNDGTAKTEEFRSFIQEWVRKRNIGVKCKV